MFSSTSTQTGRISIHALREEGDLDPSQSLRGVRISIHALREEGDLPEKDRQAVRSISIHALREEGDWQVDGTTGRLENFYPRPPRGGRRGCPRLPFRGPRISIHALREEGDRCSVSGPAKQAKNFYPRPPRGGRPPPVDSSQDGIYFYPRPPRGGRRHSERHGTGLQAISIHALREEGDWSRQQVGALIR